MKKIKFKLVVLGNLKYRLDFKKIERWKSFLFEISEPSHLNLLPNSHGPDWSYDDIQLSGILKHDNSYDITVGLINAPLEDNYYIRRISNNSVVLSLFETGETLKDENLEIENFIIRNIYEFALVYLSYDKKVPVSVYQTVAHDEIRGCLFDMNSYKPDIVFSTEKVILCDECKIKLLKCQLPPDFFENLNKELKKIKKSLFYRITDWIKSNPKWSLLLTLLSALIIEILANYIWDLINSCGN